MFLSLGALNTFIAGGARLGAALGRDRALPGWLASGGEAGQIPLRSLTVQAVLTGATLLACALLSFDLDTLMPLTSVLLAAVTWTGMLAAGKLLTTSLLRTLAVAGATFGLVVLAFSTFYLLVPVLIAGIGLLIQTTRGHTVHDPNPNSTR